MSGITGRLMRRVVACTRYTLHGCVRAYYRLTLECGHTQLRTRAHRSVRKAACVECEAAAGLQTRLTKLSPGPRSTWRAYRKEQMS